MKSVKKKGACLLALLVVLDMLSVFLAIIVGFKLRFGLFGKLPRLYESNMIYYVLIITLIALMANTLLRCYGAVWRYYSYKNVLRQFFSALLTAVFVVLIDNFIGLEMPFELFIIIPALMFVFMTLFRFVPRIFRSLQGRLSARAAKTNKSDGIKTLIYGAGEAGNYLLSKIEHDHDIQTVPVGFLDDDESLWGRKIGQLPVIGGIDSLEYAIRDLGIQELIIAIPSAKPEFVKDVFMRCQKLHVVIKRYGTLMDVSAEDFSHAPIKKVNFEELLRRDSISLNMRIVRQFIQGKTVLVTGGVGSIGSEICRQVLRFGAGRLIILDINENGLFHMKNELDDAGESGRFETILASVRDRLRLREVFAKYHPQIVFHAAAHKHVPMMEGNPKEAIKNNVLGTINVANEAILSHVEKFILISTDKAVNPTNIMGASKRIAEIAVQTMDTAGETDFAAVRFGNVLGSNGSVVPFFEKQIEQGGPVTVTHREMKRYFMTIPEAVQLVLEAGAMAAGGEIFVLDMGQPVYIYDLACDLIRMHGLEPDKDIEITITGLRPGEKLFEEISLAEEDTVKTPNNKIYINKPVTYNAQDFSRNIKKLEQTVPAGEVNEVFDIVKDMVPTFHHNGKAAEEEVESGD